MALRSVRPLAGILLLACGCDHAAQVRVASSPTQAEDAGFETVLDAEPRDLRANDAGTERDAALPPPPPPPDAGDFASVYPCNGWPALCDRPYDEITFPVSHAAMANTQAIWRFPAQQKSLRQQLDDSLRGLMLEVHTYEGAPTLCLGDCAEGHTPLSVGLGEVHAFFADNPREVVTLLIDNRVAASEIAAALGDAGLAPFLFTEAVNSRWPTLRQLISAGTRLVVFVGDATDGPPGLRAMADNVAATRSDAHVSADLNCDLPVGRSGAHFLLLQHFLVSSDLNSADGGAAIARASEELSASIHRDPGLTERLQTCRQVWNRAPAFLAVDFYDTSDVVTAAQRVNGLIGP